MGEMIGKWGTLVGTWVVLSTTMIALGYNHEKSKVGYQREVMKAFGQGEEGEKTGLKNNDQLQNRGEEAEKAKLKVDNDQLQRKIDTIKVQRELQRKQHDCTENNKKHSAGKQLQMSNKNVSVMLRRTVYVGRKLRNY
jgi:predicted acetyltransferase